MRQCPGAFCKLNPRDELLALSQDDEVFQYYHRYGEYLLGWVMPASEPPRFEQFHIPQKSITLARLEAERGEGFLDMRTLLSRGIEISSCYARTRVCWNCYQSYSKLDIERQRALEKALPRPPLKREKSSGSSFYETKPQKVAKLLAKFQASVDKLGPS